MTFQAECRSRGSWCSSKRAHFSCTTAVIVAAVSISPTRLTLTMSAFGQVYLGVGASSIS